MWWHGLLLAVALALLGHDGGSSSLPLRLAGLAAYLVVMLGVVRPVAARMAKRRSSDLLSFELLGIVVALTLLSAAATQAIGVHPLFGAFLAGVCFPRIPAWPIALRARSPSRVSMRSVPEPRSTRRSNGPSPAISMIAASTASSAV